MTKPSFIDRLQHILDAADKTINLWRLEPFEDFTKNDIYYAATQRYIEVISEAARHIPEDTKSQHPEIHWRGVSDIGNILRHAYDSVDPNKLWKIVQNDLPLLRSIARSLIDREKAEETRTFWDKRYAGADMAFGDGPNVFLSAQAHRFTPGMRALVPGDGQGRNGVWLAEQGLIVDTLDISPVGVEKAQALAAARGVAINAQLADLLTWDWPEAGYDVIASIYVHFFDADRQRMHRAMLNALKPGGVLILEAFNLGQLELQKTEGSGGPKTADMLFSAEKLRGDFADVDIELLEERIVDLAEGHRHKGRGAVVRLIARRR
jgi:uncharacterized protein with HEPN domain/SAM-dependent methyltransferase